VKHSITLMPSMCWCWQFKKLILNLKTGNRLSCSPFSLTAAGFEPPDHGLMRWLLYHSASQLGTIFPVHFEYLVIGRVHLNISQRGVQKNTLKCRLNICSNDKCPKWCWDIAFERHMFYFFRTSESLNYVMTTLTLKMRNIKALDAQEEIVNVLFSCRPQG
jgi:hypothetical protein